MVDIILTQEGSNRLLSFLFFFFFLQCCHTKRLCGGKKIKRRLRVGLRQVGGGSLVMRRGGVEVGGIIESKSPAFSLYSISQRAAGRKTNSGEQ